MVLLVVCLLYFELFRVSVSLLSDFQTHIYKAFLWSQCHGQVLNPDLKTQSPVQGPLRLYVSHRTNNKIQNIQP